MNYEKIVNPETGRKVDVNGRIGKQILDKYVNIMNGGGVCGFNSKTNRCSKKAKETPEKCVLGEKGRCRLKNNSKISSKSLKKIPHHSSSYEMSKYWGGENKFKWSSLLKNIEELLDKMHAKYMHKPALSLKELNYLKDAYDYSPINELRTEYYDVFHFVYQDEIEETFANEYLDEEVENKIDELYEEQPEGWEQLKNELLKELRKPIEITPELTEKRMSLDMKICSDLEKIFIKYNLLDAFKQELRVNKPEWSYRIHSFKQFPIVVAKDIKKGKKKPVDSSINYTGFKPFTCENINNNDEIRFWVDFINKFPSKEQQNVEVSKKIKKSVDFLKCLNL